jgi:NadR type nicotinamide-nucleotide adenylyltransferase
VVGAESTGTTTLAQSLAEALQTNWVAEYGREYSGIKLARNETNWRTEEFELIAQEQMRRENQAAREANRVLVCDTNAFATGLWHRRYMGRPGTVVDEVGRRAKCDLYLLTGDEIPFVQDGLRDGEHIRKEMHQWFEHALAGQPVPWKLLRGSHSERMRAAGLLIAEMFNGFSWRPKSAKFI